MAINAVGRTTIQGATTVGGFNPATLFSAGEQGVWYDPSDLSTLFQDSAGTIPVTALEQPVGRMLDKSGRGNHATQSTNTSFRPVVSARVNLLTYTQDVRNTAAAGSTRPWLNTGTGTIALASAIAPDGTLTGNLVPEDNAASTFHYVSYYPVSLTSGVSYTASVFLKQGTQRYAGIHFNDGTARGCSIDLQTGTLGTPYGSATAAVSLVNGWYQLRITATSTGSATSEVAIYLSDTNALAPYNGTGKNIYVWGADLRPTNQGVGLPVYQRVGAAVAGTSTTAGNADYNANGFPVYLSFDGSNDSLATGNINFSATDKMTAWTGVRKTKTAGNFGMLVELSSSIANNNSFNIAAPGAAVAPSTENYTFITCGSANFTGYDAVTFTPPITSVLSCAYDNAGATRADQVKPRVNGVIPTLNAGGSGNTSSGNYSNSPLYIGARAGTSIFFAGNLYGLIVRGASSTSNQITGAENWLNQKTAAY